LIWFDLIWFDLIWCDVTGNWGRASIKLNFNPLNDINFPKLLRNCSEIDNSITR
jgi:hypothetical protein